MFQGWKSNDLVSAGDFVDDKLGEGECATYKRTRCKKYPGRMFFWDCKHLGALDGLAGAATGPAAVTALHSASCKHGRFAVDADAGETVCLSMGRHSCDHTQKLTNKQIQTHTPSSLVL